MNNYNVVGDIAGNFLTLKALLAKMPQDAELLSLGDPNDRGPRSKEVIEFLMKNGKTVNSNHAHMFVENWQQSAMPGAAPRYYEWDLFFYNGGNATMDSYAGTPPGKWGSLGKEVHELVPASHIEFLEKCPMYIETSSYVFSHAPLHIRSTLESASKLGNGFASPYDIDLVSEFSLIWNRYVPDRPHPHLNGRIHIFGHNSSDMVKVYTTQFLDGKKVDNEGLQVLLSTDNQYPIYAICLDTSRGKKLTGLHLPSMTLYEQEYID